VEKLVIAAGCLGTGLPPTSMDLSRGTMPTFLREEVRLDVGTPGTRWNAIKNVILQRHTI